MTDPRLHEYARSILASLTGDAALHDRWLEVFALQLRERQVDLDPLLRRLVDEVTPRMGADRGTLYLVDHARNELVSHIAHLPEIEEIRLAMGDGIAGIVAKTRRPLRVPSGDRRIDVRIDQQTGYHTSSVLAVPIVHEDRLLGVLQLLNKPGGFGSEDEEKVSRLGVEIGGLLAGSSLGSQVRPGQRQPLAFRFNHIVGESALMRAVYERTDRAARTDATVLLRGESGSGKEVVARAVHWNSPRAEGPFVKVDCAALPASLIENELFGHEKGAFTGAGAMAVGKVDLARGGTLLLDEIGELDPAVQGKLLRLVQDRTYLRVGGTQPLEADVRFVCATHRDLEGLVATGAFRKDLYYRIRVVEIRLPTLHDRGANDLDRLIDHFLYVFSERHGRRGLELSPAARALLHAHPWPGNVRELENCIESSVVLAPGPTIEAEGLSLAPESLGGGISGDFTTPLRSLREVEARYLRHVLEHCEGNRTRAAELLGIGRNTLNRRLKESLGIDS